MERSEITKNSVGEELLDNSMNHQAKQLLLMKMTKISFPAKLQSIVLLPASTARTFFRNECAPVV
jgi:hypothetical protein